MPLPLIEQETAANPTHSVIWLHGLGADGHDFAPIVPELIWPSAPPVRFIFPHAPLRSISINQGIQMRAWYDIFGLESNTPQDEEGIRASIQEIEILIAQENNRGVPHHHIVLGGFSQGGALALAAGLRYPAKLAGIVALSTYLPLATQLTNERSVENQQTPLFWGHGSNDPIVRYEHGQQSKAWLEQLGYTVQWHSYQIAHQVCAQELADLRDWLAITMPGKTS